jgi:formamidopyrimidine-DNA glycosylase
MPELPEVETVRRQLAGSLTGLAFVAVERTEPAMLIDCTATEVVAGLPGRRVKSVERLGKFIVVTLSAEVFLTLHLGMTGQLLVDPREDPGPHTRFLFRLKNPRGHGTTLEFRDARKFGRLHLTTGGPPARLGALGPDAWLGSWDAGYLAGRLHGRKVALKAFLLDQRHLAGIGNIYADEILWWTGLSPLRQSGSLTAGEVGRLSGEIRRRLDEGVRLLGCSLSDFVDTAGQPGEFQDWLQAYGRQGQACSRCGGTFVRVVIGGRGTAYCPGCQR